MDFYFVPRDLVSRRHMGPRMAAAGTSYRGAKGPRIAAPRDLVSRRHLGITIKLIKFCCHTRYPLMTRYLDSRNQYCKGQGEYLLARVLLKNVL